MFKLLLVVLAIIAVASAQFLASPYSYGYSTYGIGYPVAYSAYTPYAYNAFLYR